MNLPKSKRDGCSPLASADNGESKVRFFLMILAAFFVTLVATCDNPMLAAAAVASEEFDDSKEAFNAD